MIRWPVFLCLLRSGFVAGVVMMAVAAMACRRDGEASASRAGEKEGKSPGSQRLAKGEEKERAKEDRKSDAGRLPEGWVTWEEAAMEQAAIERLPKPFSDHSGKFSQELATELKLTPSAYEELARITPGLLQRVKEAQLEPLGPLEFPVDKTVVIPGLAAGRIDKFVEELRLSMPGDVDDEASLQLVQMFRGKLENEYGEKLRVTLRRTRSVDIRDFRGPPELLGLKFEIVCASRSEGRPVYYSAVHREGSRFDFLKVPPGVKGFSREEFFE